METITLFLLVSCFVGIISGYDGGQETAADNYEDDSGKCYGNGPIKSENICSLCFCRNNQKSCTRQSCTQGVPRGCKEVKVPGKCCPEIKCPEESSYDGQGTQSDKYKEGKDESYCSGTGPIVSSNPCSLCFCRNNQKTCTRQSCRQGVPRGCSEVAVPGKCCPEIRCPDSTPPGQVDNYGEQESQIDNYEETPRDDPSNPGRCFGDGEIPNPNPCNKCVCRNGRKACPAWNCPQRPSGPNCRFVKVPDQCCPKEQCDIVTRRPPTSECSSGDGPLIHPNPCNKCTCKSGIKYCMKIRCTQLVSRRGCKIQKLEGQCCATLVCYTNPTTSVPDNYGQSEDVVVNWSDITRCKKNGPISSDNPCNQCSCYNGNMNCRKISCPSVQPGCFARNNPGECCPKIVCETVEKKY